MIEHSGELPEKHLSWSREVLTQKINKYKVYETQNVMNARNESERRTDMTVVELGVGKVHEDAIRMSGSETVKRGLGLKLSVQCTRLTSAAVSRMTDDPMTSRSRDTPASRAINWQEATDRETEGGREGE